MPNNARHLLKEAIVACKGNALLICAGIAWWTSHFLLLWNVHITAIDSFLVGYDGRFIFTIAGTVLMLGIMTIIAFRRPHFEFADHRWTYIVFAACTSLALGLLLVPILLPSASMIGAIGAVLSGLGNSFALVLYGELHARMGYRFIPIACAIESFSGTLIFFLVSPLPLEAVCFFAAVFIVAAAILYYRYSRTPAEHGVQASFEQMDMTLELLLVLAVLTGLAYGFVRTFTVGGLQASDLHLGMTAEGLGTCLCALLLAGVFFLQHKQSPLKQCLLFVAPLIATGMLLIPFQNAYSVLSIIVNTAGFACFFDLMWYFAAVLAVSSKHRHMTFIVALLFFVSQLAQMLGALVPAQFVNAFSSAMIYLLLLVAIVFMYWRTKNAPLASTRIDEASIAHTGESTLPNTLGQEPTESEAETWTEQFGFSPRELQIAMMLAQRIPYKQISSDLYVSENTVKTHARNIYKKAGVSSREELLEKLSELAKKG